MKHIDFLNTLGAATLVLFVLGTALGMYREADLIFGPLVWWLALAGFFGAVAIEFLIRWPWRWLQKRVRLLVAGWLLLVSTAVTVGLASTLAPLPDFAWAWRIICAGVFLGALVVFVRHRRYMFPWLPVLAATASVTASVTVLLMLGETGNPFTIVYRAAQLFTGQGGWTVEVMRTSTDPLIAFLLHFARLSALVATLSAVLALFRDINDWLQVKLAPKRDHTLLCGLGEAGTEFVRQWDQEFSAGERSAPDSLLVIERDPENPNIEPVRNLGYPVLIGDVFDEYVMRKAGVTHACQIVHMLPDDKRNVELAIAVRRYFRKPPRGLAKLLRHLPGHRLAAEGAQRTTKLLVHVDDTRLARRAQDHGRLGAEAEKHTETRFFNFYESAARKLLRDHPMTRYAAIQDAPYPHLAIYGLGQMGEALLRQALLLCCHPAGSRLQISVFDRRVASGALENHFWRAHRELEKLVRERTPYKPAGVSVNFYGLENARCGVKANEIRQTICGDKLPPPTQHIVCFDSDEISATFGLSLRTTLRDMPPIEGNRSQAPQAWDAPVFIRLKRRRGLARLFLEIGGQGIDAPLDTPDSMFAFGMLDDVVKPTEVIDEARDQLAATLHEDGYRKQRGLIPPVNNIWRKESGVPWSELPLHYKASNRAQADHVATKLGSLGCTINTPNLENKHQDFQSRWAPLRGCREPIELLDLDQKGEYLTSVQRRYTTQPVEVVWQCWRNGSDKQSSPGLYKALEHNFESRRRRWQKPKDGGLTHAPHLHVGGPRSPSRGSGREGDAQLKWIRKGSRPFLEVRREGRREAKLALPEDAKDIGASAEAYSFVVAQVKSKGSGTDGSDSPWYLWRLDTNSQIPWKVLDHAGTGRPTLQASPQGKHCALLLEKGKDDSSKNKRELRLVKFAGTASHTTETQPVQLPLESGLRSDVKHLTIKRLAFNSAGDALLAVWVRTSQDDVVEATGLVVWKIDGEPPYQQRHIDLTDDSHHPVSGLKDGCTGLDRFALDNGHLYCVGSYREDRAPAVYVYFDRDDAPRDHADETQTILLPLTLHAGACAFAYRSERETSDRAGDMLAIGCKDSEILLVRHVPGWADRATGDRPEQIPGPDQNEPLQGIQCPNGEPIPDCHELAEPWLRLLRQPWSAEISMHNRELLARVEHDRWSVFHLLDNWRYDQERVDAARVHKNLCPWERLDPGTRDFDSGHVAGLPMFIEKCHQSTKSKRAEQQICREVRIGIVGHRPGGLNVPGLSWLGQDHDVEQHPGQWSNEAKAELKKLREAIQAVLEPSPDDLPVRVVVVTPLAEGADRILAKGLMDPCHGLDADLIALLPLPWELYYRTFTQDPPEQNKRSVDEFSGLIARASSHVELPMRFGNLHALGTDSDKPEKWPTSQQRQFQLANAWIAQHCDYLLAAWNGKEIECEELDELPCDAKLCDAFATMPNGSKEALYTRQQRPGGTWEAVRWWLDPSRIPSEMTWRHRYRQSYCANRSDGAGRLFLIGRQSDASKASKEHEAGEATS